MFINNKIFSKDKKIYLANLTPDYANSQYYNWLRDKEINRFLEIRHSPPSKLKLRNYIKNVNKSKNEILLGIFLSKNKDHIGNIKIGPINWKYKRAAIGLLLGDKTIWRKGYGSSAIIILTNYAFKKIKLKRVSAGCYKSNIGSYKAFIKAGYKFEACLKKYWKFKNKWEDELLIAKINHEI